MAEDAEAKCADPLYVYMQNGSKRNYKIPKKVLPINPVPSTSMISQATGPKRHQIAPIEMEEQEKKPKINHHREKREFKKEKRKRPEVAKAPLDNILGEMDRTEKKRRLEAVKNEIESSPVHNSILEEGVHLSREWLETRTPDEKMVNEFLARDTIMEYLLGRKMAFGRLDPWHLMGFERKTLEDDKIIPAGYFRQPQNREEKPKPKGPKTPPGSPGPKTPPPGPSTTEDAFQKDKAMFDRLAAMSGTTTENLAAFFQSDTWRTLIKNQQSNNINNGDQRQTETKPQIKTEPESQKKTNKVEEMKTPGLRRISSSDSVKMELVSDDSLSVQNSPLLAPPPPPPMIPMKTPEECPPPPPPPLSDYQHLPPVWPTPPPPFIPDVSAPPPGMSRPQPPPPRIPPPVVPPPPVEVLPPVRIQPRVIPPPVGPPQPLMSIPTPLTVPPPKEPEKPKPKPAPKHIPKPPAPKPPPPPVEPPRNPWMASQLPNWSDAGDWSHKDEWRPGGAQNQGGMNRQPAPPPLDTPSNDIITKNLMNALGLMCGGGGNGPGRNNGGNNPFPPPAPPCSVPLAFGNPGVPPPDVGMPPPPPRGGFPPPSRGGRGGPGQFNGGGGPPPPGPPLPLLSAPVPPAPLHHNGPRHNKNMNQKGPGRRRGGGGGRPMKL